MKGMLVTFSFKYYNFEQKFALDQNAHEKAYRNKWDPDNTFLVNSKFRISRYSCSSKFDLIS